MCRVINWIANSKIYSKPIEITAASTDVINLNTKKKREPGSWPKGRGCGCTAAHSSGCRLYIPFLNTKERAAMNAYYAITVRRILYSRRRTCRNRYVGGTRRGRTTLAPVMCGGRLLNALDHCYR